MIDARHRRIRPVKTRTRVIAGAAIAAVVGLLGTAGAAATGPSSGSEPNWATSPVRYYHDCSAEGEDSGYAPWLLNQAPKNPEAANTLAAVYAGDSFDGYGAAFAATAKSVQNVLFDVGGQDPATVSAFISEQKAAGTNSWLTGSPTLIADLQTFAADDGFTSAGRQAGATLTVQALLADPAVQSGYKTFLDHALGANPWATSAAVAYTTTASTALNTVITGYATANNNGVIGDETYLFDTANAFQGEYAAWYSGMQNSMGACVAAAMTAGNVSWHRNPGDFVTVTPAATPRTYALVPKGGLAISDLYTHGWPLNLKFGAITGRYSNLNLTPEDHALDLAKLFPAYQFAGPAYLISDDVLAAKAIASSKAVSFTADSTIVHVAVTDPAAVVKSHDFDFGVAALMMDGTQGIFSLDIGFALPTPPPPSFNPPPINVPKAPAAPKPAPPVVSG